MTSLRVHSCGPVSAQRRSLVVCADVGSTFTKAMAVDTATAELLATAEHPTTARSDVLEGLDACLDALRDALPRARFGQPLVCSSAGGGLRLAVVGYEPLVTAQAGHRVGLSAGAKVVHVAAGRLDAATVAALRAAAPDVVLLVGGTDGGDTEVLVHNATRLARARLGVPVVAAGNREAAGDVETVLSQRGAAVTVTDNVLPRIGHLVAGPARAAIREVFLRHVIGGKNLSRGSRFPRLVHGPTPDIVLAGVEAMADGAGSDTPSGDIVVVDVGGATTDVYSVLTPDAERSAARREVSGSLWRSRTVEGDLGMRHNAPGIVAAARAERLIDEEQAARLAPAADRRAAHPGLVGADADEAALDAQLAGFAVTVALRRHARGERRADGSRGPGRDLRQVRLVVGSGGVLRHARLEDADRLVHCALTDHAGGYPLPREATCRVDRHYVLAAVGLLAAGHPDVAAALAGRYLGAGRDAARR